MRRKRVKTDSVLDAGPPIPPNLLSVIRIVILLIGVIISLSILFVPSWYSFAGVVTAMAITGLLMAVVMVVESINNGRADSDLIKRSQRANPEGLATQRLVSADYETLEAEGQAQLAEEQQEARE